MADRTPPEWWNDGTLLVATYPDDLDALGVTLSGGPRPPVGGERPGGSAPARGAPASPLGGGPAPSDSVLTAQPFSPGATADEPPEATP